MKGPILYSFGVTHPDYGTVYVDALDRAEAVMKAAERWGVKWTGIAAYCDVRKGGKAQKPKCRHCGQEINTAGLCPSCQSAEEMRRREMARMRTPDRRAGYRERYRDPA